MVSRAERQGLIHSGMQQTLRKCSEYSKNRILIKTSWLWEYVHGQQFEQFVGSIKMYCFTGFELVCVFPTVLRKYCYKCQGFGLTNLAPRSRSWSWVFKGLDNDAEHMISVTELYRRPATRHRHVFAMTTVVICPSFMRTVSYRSLVAYTLYVVQQDTSTSGTITISNYRSFIPETKYSQYSQRAKYWSYKDLQGFRIKRRLHCNFRHKMSVWNWNFKAVYKRVEKCWKYDTIR